MGTLVSLALHRARQQAARALIRPTPRQKSMAEEIDIGALCFCFLIALLLVGVVCGFVRWLLS